MGHINCRVKRNDGKGTIVPQHVTSEIADMTVTAAHNAGRELPDTVAVTVASWWQSPGTVGRVLAQLSTTGECDVQALLDDISATRREVPESDWKNRLALDMLATWAIQHPSRLDIYKECEWFAGCDYPAVRYAAHPVLVSVPACDRCLSVGR